MPDYNVFTKVYEKITHKLVSEVMVVCESKKLRADALWDTGATSTCISKRLISNLCLVPVGSAMLFSANNRTQVSTYNVDILLSTHTHLKNIIVAETDIEKQGIDLLIGMDIITRGDLSICNYSGKTTFSFVLPSVSSIDYTEILPLSYKNKSDKNSGTYVRVVPHFFDRATGKWVECGY